MVLDGLIWGYYYGNDSGKIYFHPYKQSAPQQSPANKKATP